MLRNADDWTTVCKKIKAKKINYAKAKMTMNGVAITPSSTQDYRSLTKLLNDNKKEYHTYALAEDKTTRASRPTSPLITSPGISQARDCKLSPFTG